MEEKLRATAKYMIRKKTNVAAFACVFISTVKDSDYKQQHYLSANVSLSVGLYLLFLLNLSASFLFLTISFFTNDKIQATLCLEVGGIALTPLSHLVKHTTRHLSLILIRCLH